jgi:iron-sulfur cluster insertion protein
MNEPQTYTPQPLIFTKPAANKVWELIKEDGNPDLNLRVFITGGGCSGFQYGFAFEQEIAEDDTVVTGEADDDSGGEGSATRTVRLLVDPMSYTYLVGAEIDYKDDLEGGRFIIRNPNAQTTCGCGSSFSA